VKYSNAPPYCDGEKGMIQPAMKVRGRDYLRIIYGPDYDLPENIDRLRQRGVGRKLSLAEHKFKLGFKTAVVQALFPRYSEVAQAGQQLIALGDCYKR
jgi:hypothetical protein